jgi:probable F420-dependent oxidoreductase
MKLGAVFPQTEIDSSPETATRFARAVEERGYDLLLAYDHVLGANPADPDFQGPYDNDDVFHEPLTLFAYLAGVTETIALGTSVLILPQRQTALVAKQAAEVDVLSGGRLRLGVGVGWNDLEYEGLGMDFGTRGQRIEEQIEVLRRLWTEDVVAFEGRWHSLPDAGINPRPVQQPVPLWLGGDADPVLRRVGRTGNGWLPRGTAPGTSLDEIEGQLATIREHAREAGRDPDDLRVVPRIQPEGDPEEWVEHARQWRDLGATHLTVDTIGMDLTVEEHIGRATAFYEAMVDAGLGDG